jgi:hypothetical protein
VRQPARPTGERPRLSTPRPVQSTKGLPMNTLKVIGAGINE